MWKTDQEIADEYLRDGQLPHMFCPGCGIGITLNNSLRAIDELGWDKNDMAWVSGIGCSSRVPSYVDADAMHTTHGRALAFATGIKVANPDQKVVVFAGDGDMAGIGGNHLIHAIRRNIDINVILINNFIYGMTGGQTAPTTPSGSKSSTAPFGNVEHPFDISELATSAGASYVARWTVNTPQMIKDSVKKGFSKKGFSLIEVMSPCPVSFGRRNEQPTAVDIMEWYKENTTQDEDEADEKILVGEFVDKELEEYTDELRKLKKRESLEGIEIPNPEQETERMEE